MKSNPHAVALGRKGGRANTKAQQAARRKNIAKGGKPRIYRLVGGTLERRVGDRWHALAQPYDAAALAFLRRNR